MPQTNGNAAPKRHPDPFGATGGAILPSPGNRAAGPGVPVGPIVLKNSLAGPQSTNSRDMVSLFCDPAS